MRQLRWSRDARSDMSAIDAYYRPRNIPFAQRVLAQAVAAGRMLQQHPQAGQMIDDEGLRKWRVARTPYILLYRDTGTLLHIVRVMHAAQDWRGELP
ncbi:MAG: type II toxin-antitoxin system RelE/ParE family toxin [Sphingomonas sp.]